MHILHIFLQTNKLRGDHFRLNKWGIRWHVSLGLKQPSSAICSTGSTCFVYKCLVLNNNSKGGKLSIPCFL